MREESKSEARSGRDPKESLTNIKPFDVSPLEVINEMLSDNGCD